MVTLALLFAAPAMAGNETYAGIAAASADGRYAAVFYLSEGRVDAPAALLRSDRNMEHSYEEPALATAACGDFNTFLEYSRWTWDKRVPELSALKVFSDRFDDKSDGKRARIAWDPDTVMARLEILESERWWPVRALPGEVANVTGTIELSDRYLIRVRRDADIHHWDELYSIVRADVPAVGARWLRGRGEALTATGALRELREKGARPFTKRPRGARDAQAWDYRRAKALDPVIVKWESAGSFGPFTPQDLLDLVWLYAARAKPGDKLRALRVFLRLKGRDPQSAQALLAVLGNDPDTSEMMPILEQGRDPLKNVEHLFWPARTVDELRPLSDDDLSWLHRGFWAMGGFRFADPKFNEYFSCFDWYQPVSEKTWKKLMADSFFQKNPNKAVLVERFWKTLDAVVELEKERGLSSPEL